MIFHLNFLEKNKYVEDIKRNISKWIKTKGAPYQYFAWQNGYAGFSVSSSNKDTVVRHIANQKEHHKTLSFKEEVVLRLSFSNYL